MRLSCPVEIYFNPLPRKEGDEINGASVDLEAEHFNPHPRKEVDVAPEMDATLLIAISIHSLVKRETLIFIIYVISSMYFNPLPRKEGD